MCFRVSGGVKRFWKNIHGGVLGKHLNIHFLRIEPIFIELLKREADLAGILLEQRGFQMVLAKLDELAQSAAA